MARNRKRSNQRQARRPTPVASVRAGLDDTPEPIAHGTPDVELAEAQLAMGRPEAPEAADDVEPSQLDGDAAAPDVELGQPELDDGDSALELSGNGDLVAEGRTSSASEELEASSGAVATRPSRSTHAAATWSAPSNRLINFLQGSWLELQRVQWPDRRQVIQATSVVIGFVIVAGAFLGLADLVSTKLMNLILK